jgi:hypothetical protein
MGTVKIEPHRQLSILPEPADFRCHHRAGSIEDLVPGFMVITVGVQVRGVEVRHFRELCEIVLSFLCRKILTAPLREII